MGGLCERFGGGGRVGKDWDEGCECRIGTRA